MKKIAFIFPGQGAQYVGMGKDFADQFAIARETFEEADRILNYPLSQIIFEGPEDVLVQTQHAQVAIFVTSIAILRVLEQQMPELRPQVCAGLSLGEYTALCASGKLSFSETLLLVQKRALFMQEACEKVPGTMAAVLGLTGPQVEEALKGLEGVWVANYNCPGQIVISGTKDGVEKGSVALKETGAKRVLPLTVSGAFHSGLMEMASVALAPFVMGSSIEETAVELVMNAPGGFVSKVDEIRKYLISQVTESVRWESGIFAMNERGVDLYIEIGCGKTLSGMNRKIGVSGQTISIEKVADLEALGKQISEGIKCTCC
jgi:[acyl-carrier-protein] S-malonyltransferase